MPRNSITPVQRTRRVGEMAGGTAAECAAVCCCCPCAMVHFAVLALYTVPKGLLKKAVMKKRSKRQRSLEESTNKNKNKNKNNNVVVFVGPTLLEEYMAKEVTEAVALENEMWTRFAGTGFWRSESQREP
ncbi:PREDICTED: uncharacterized protein LOC109355230 isoform X2 [Lupinus angustifolius]|uniref:uncharacterized protein LOC109355230 isoform X2 n=1 Tax=Lupinus angustifolius TaxID=3871 RepID=UPI00092E22F0|nr:PREDICTED: uncharacterized protein LOC109355230 isoform X2 [Lupinus angustifolius]